MPKPSDAPRALILCPEAPFPVVGGGPLRTASLVHYLADRYHLDAIVFWEPDSPNPEDEFPEGLLDHLLVLKLPYHSKDLLPRTTRNVSRWLRGVPPHDDRFGGKQAQVADWLAGRNYDLAVVEHFWCSGYAGTLRGHSRRLALDLHNVESEYYSRRASVEPWPMKAALEAFAAANRKLEAERLPLFDLLLTASIEDAVRLKHRQSIVYPNSIPACPQPDRDERAAIAFTGNLEFPPNITAVTWFRDHVWNKVRGEFADLEWRIIGKNPRAVDALVQGTPGVNVMGPVDDAVAELAQCQVAIAPILSGSGTRLKILEAWAAGTPVVSTRLGAEGLPVQQDNQVALADTPEDFAGKLIELLRDPIRRTRLGTAGRRLYEQAFTWERAWEILQSHGL